MIELPSALVESGAYPPNRALSGFPRQCSLPLACRHLPKGTKLELGRGAHLGIPLNQIYRRRFSTDRLICKDRQFASSLEGDPGPTAAGKTLPHSYPETRFRKERARDVAIIAYWKDQSYENFRRTRTMGPNCAIMCDLIHKTTCVEGVLPREVAQAAMVPTALVSRSLVEGYGQGAASVLSIPFRVGRPSAQLETFPACMFFPGIPQGQRSYQRARHSTPPFCVSSV